MKTRNWIIIGILALLVALIAAAPASACDDCECEGCTPGYWKNHLDAWVGFSPDDLVGNVFVAAPARLADDTLLDALNYRGGAGRIGGARILLRAGVAALLNASHPDVNFPRSVGGIITHVNAALSTGMRYWMIYEARIMDNQNNLGCPLN
jgi:hypothetical protein